VPDAALTQAEVVDAPEASRYTEVDESYEGRGLGNRLAEAALEDVRGKGLVVVPLCPFIARYIQQHPEYHDLVATS
jgi:predicted GNAT family acetyltransferase